MAEGSLIFYAVGGILLAFAFAAHVVHAVLLANGRRALALLAPARQPAFAGVVSGSFVDARARGGRFGDRTETSMAPGEPFTVMMTLTSSLLLSY